MTTYYIDQICGSRIGSNANPPSDQGEDPTGWSSSSKFWIGVRVRCSNSTKATAGQTITLRWRRGGGAWTTLAASGELKYPGTGNMVYTDLTPPNTDWFCGAIDCGLTNCTDGVAQDNSASLSATLDACELELWWAADPAGQVGGGFYEFAIYDSAGKFGTESSPTLLACSVTAASADVNVDAQWVSMTLTSYQATVDRPVGITASYQDLALTTYQTGIDLNTNISAGCPELVLTTYQAGVDRPVGVDASYQDLTLTTYQAGVVLSEDVNIDATCPDLTLTAYQTGVDFPVDISASYQDLALTTYQAGVSLGIIIDANCPELTLTTYQLAIQFDWNLDATCPELTLTVYGATLGYDVLLDALYQDLTLTAYQANVQLVESGSYIKRNRGFLISSAIYGKT